ncbi:hypothetical protein GGF43_006960, partial [Coemansia sp. RSA 2618]
KRTPALVTTSRPQQQQQQQQKTTTPPANVNANKVPKFTVPQSEFLTANLFAQHRQLVATPDKAATCVSAPPRLSFKTVSELLICKGQTPDEAGVPHAKLRQIYAAPTSVYMRVANEVAMMPEAARLGPLAEPLLGRDMFADGVGTLGLDAREVTEFVDDFFDSLEERAANGRSPSWSLRREMQEQAMVRGSRWMTAELVDPVSEITGDHSNQGSDGYHMTSVRRKRRTKMKKH